MEKSIIKLLLLIVCFFTTIVIKAQRDTISKNLIDKSIQTFVNLLDSQDVQQFGLKSIAELKTLKAGRQFKKYTIGLSAIKKYKQGDDVKKIIDEYPSIEVSLVDGSGKIRTSIQFVKKNNKWEATGYGSTPELIHLRNAQNELAKSSINKGNLIRIPALQTSFIAVSSAAGLEFISLENNQKLKFIKGQKIPASEAILRLVPFANKHKGLPN